VPAAALTATVARESFVPWGAAPVRALEARLGQGRAGDPPSRELARVVGAARPELVLCYADLHLANHLVDGEDRLAVVTGTGRRWRPGAGPVLPGDRRAATGSWRGSSRDTGRSRSTARPWPTTAGSGWCRSSPTTAAGSTGSWKSGEVEGVAEAGELEVEQALGDRFLGGQVGNTGQR
jgi:hypothetical protein